MALSNLSKGRKGQVLASCGNKYDPRLIAEATRVQFGELHLSEGRPPARRYAYLAAQEEDHHEDRYADEAEPGRGTAGTDEEEEEPGDMSEMEDELAEMQARQEEGSEIDEERYAVLAEALAAEQHAFVARRELRALKQETRPDRSRSRSNKGSGRGHKGQKKGILEERRKRIEDSKKRTMCRDCGKTGHWAGDPECERKDSRRESSGGLPPGSRQGRFQPRGGRGSHHRQGTKTGYFAVASRPGERGRDSWMAIKDNPNPKAKATSSRPGGKGRGKGGGGEEDMEVDEDDLLYREPAPAAPWIPSDPTAASRATEEVLYCGEACEVEDCDCEGFGACIGRPGHLRGPHRCCPMPVRHPGSVCAAGLPEAPPLRRSPGRERKEPIPPPPWDALPAAAPAPWSSSASSSSGPVVNVAVYTSDGHVAGTGRSVRGGRGAASGSGGSRGGPKTDFGVKDDLGHQSGTWPAGDRRRCTRCKGDTLVTRYSNQICHVWVCQGCRKRCAIVYFQTCHKHNGGFIEHCHMAVTDKAERGRNRRAGRAADEEDDDPDAIARLDTMCTSNMHGEAWMERYRHRLRRLFQLDVISEP